MDMRRGAVTSPGEVRRAQPAFVLSAFLVLGGCGGGTSGAGGGAPADVSLGARFGGPGEVAGRVKYKARGGGRELDVEVMRAKPGTVYAVVLDGAALGDLRVGLEGDGEMKLASLPAGLTGPSEGSIVKVGPFEVSLQMLEKLADYSAEFGGAGSTVDASYKVERLGGRVLRELEIEIDGDPPATYTVSVDGFALGELSLNSEGDAEMSFSDAAGPSFPQGFPELRLGAAVRVGSLEGRLLEKK